MRSRRGFICAAGAVLAQHYSSPVFAQEECPIRVGEFSGTVKAEWLTKTSQMRLLEPFGFKGPDCREWPVPRGAVVDGASIPRVFWTLIGGPFEGRYRDGSVVHDYYCKVRTAASDDVHEMFYHAMLANGVDSITAGVMYFAVKWFGPQWQYLKRIGVTGDFEAHVVVRNFNDMKLGSVFFNEASAVAGQPSPQKVTLMQPYQARSTFVDQPWLLRDGTQTTKHTDVPAPDAWDKSVQAGVSKSIPINLLGDYVKVYSSGRLSKEPVQEDVERIKRWIAVNRPSLATMKQTPPERIPS